MQEKGNGTEHNEVDDGVYRTVPNSSNGTIDDANSHSIDVSSKKVNRSSQTDAWDEQEDQADEPAKD